MISFWYKIKIRNLNFSTLCWCAVVIHSETAILFSKYDCPIYLDFRDMTFFHDFSVFGSKN